MPFRRIAPGAAMLGRYQAGWLGADIAAGLSVAAVAIPTAIAYAQLAGFPAEVGLYSAILPLVAYALFGSSRQLMVNPDAATCAMVGAIVAPMAAGDINLQVALASALAIFSGVLCVVAGALRLGFLADFLGRPVLVGFMNGIAISIFLGQIGKLFGFPLESNGIFPRLMEFVTRLPSTHVPTLAVGVATFATLRLVRRFLPRWPSPLVALVMAVLLVRLFHLDERGVAVLGSLPAGLPPIRWPEFPLELLKPLLESAIGLALVSVTSGMVTARSFAARNREELDVDREFIAFGAGNVASGLSGGFAVTGADSRTAVAASMGGKSQVTGLVAALALALVLLFLTGPLQYFPICALGAILISAALGLFDMASLRRLARIKAGEFAVSVVAMLGVVVLGALEGIAVAVVLALMVLLLRSSRPVDAVLGRIAGLDGFHSVARYPEARQVPGILVYRFNSSLIFYNCAYFRRRILEHLAAHPDTRQVVIDGSPIVHVDSTGADMLSQLADELRANDIRLVLAEMHVRVLGILERSEALAHLGPGANFPTLEAAIEAAKA
ncbi:MAG TPA: SulP family inorganic anion transporter [Candidatus Eisenbacteria bacterium]